MDDERLTPDDFKYWREITNAGDAARLQREVARYGDALPRGPHGETLLHAATSYHFASNRAALIEVLLAAGRVTGHVDSRDNSGQTPLHWAAGYGCAECIPLLLKAGADVRAERNDGGEPLHRASEKTIDQILAAGGDPMARDKYGRYPLHTSIVRHKALLVPGVNVRDGDSMTALHHAALTGDEELVAWLLASGADPALELTQDFDLNADLPDDPWNTRKELYPAGMRAYDIAKKEHDHTRWNTGQHRAVVEMLDKVTPRRGWFRR